MTEKDSNTTEGPDELLKKRRSPVETSKNNLPRELWHTLSLDNMAFLRQLPLFKNLPEKNLDLISQHFKHEHYARDDVIVRQGSLADSFFIIKSGLVEISNLSSNGASNFIRYMEQQDFFGEIGVLTGQNRSATVTAVTSVDILVMDEEGFYAMLAKNVEVAIELARVLAYRLSDTDKRLANKLIGSNLILVISARERLGGTTIANAMTLMLASSTEAPTAYAEFPQKDLASAYGFHPSHETYDHPGGFQILNPKFGLDISESAQISFLMDQASMRFKNIIVYISAELAQQLGALVSCASQIVMVTSSQREDWEQTQKVIASLKQQILRHKTRFFTVVNHTDAADSDELINAVPDFVIPFLDPLPPIAERRVENLPEPLKAVTTKILKLLSYTNQIGIYLPTTIGVDSRADTSSFVKKTLALMGKLFGGATYEKAKGLWNSQEVGLVEEEIHLVRSYCSQAELDKHMGEVVDYVETLKQDLHQEAMALEVNQKLMLI
ncbi:MAG: Crp/Fnr family transcriptional regulator [Chlamydiales bacterium]